MPAATAQVQGWLEHELGRPLDTASVARLAANLNLLGQGGIVTPDQIHQWASGRHGHDFAMACGKGFITQTGYLLGMELATTVIAAKLPANVLSNPSVFGAVLGAIVAGHDVATTVFGEKFMEHWFHAGSAEDLPPGVGRSMAGAVIHDAAWATGINAAKNITRAILPFIQQRIQNRPDGLISLRASDLADVAWDGGAGIFAGMVDSARKMHQGGSVPYLPRLFLQPPNDFADLVNRTHAGPRVEVPTADPATASQRGRLASMFPGAVVALSVLGIIVVHISMLVGRNASILEAGHRGRDLPQGQVDPHVMSVKGLSSTHQMALLTLVINLLAPYIGMAAGTLVDSARTPQRPAFGWPSFLRPGLPPVPSGPGSA